MNSTDIVSTVTNYCERRRLEWIRVHVKGPISKYEDSISNWCFKHITGHWSARARINEAADYYFEYEKDATMFALRWS